MPLVAKQPFNSIGLVGLGLIGGSFALAAQARWSGVVLSAYDPSGAARDWANANGSITLADSIDQLVAASELIVIAAPLAQIKDIMAQLGDALSSVLGDGTVIIDLASTKSSVLHSARHSLGAAVSRFVACHPIAGSEQSGARHARADLFDDKPVVLTPQSDTSPDALQAVTVAWQMLGARVVTMDGLQHDKLFAYLSHAPHLIAFVYMLQAKTLDDQQLALAGSGFRDFTRIAGSNPELWADILLDNRASVIELLEEQRQGIAQMVEWLRSEQRGPLIDALSAARDKRASLA